MVLAANGVKRFWPDKPRIKAAADPATILGLPRLDAAYPGPSGLGKRFDSA